MNVPDSRFHVERHTNNNTYVLTIDKVQEVDTGLYACQIVAGLSNKVNAEVWLFVRIPPVIFDNSTRHVITSTGTDITLDCYATGFPSPVIFWRRERNELLPNSHAALYKGNSLTIRNVTKRDRGTYYCVADNGVIPGSRRAISVEVEFEPEVRVGRPRYGQALLHDAVLGCNVEAFPSPSIGWCFNHFRFFYHFIRVFIQNCIFFFFKSIVWLKDGQQLTDNQHYQINIYSTSDEFTTTSLRVLHIEKKQYGNYTCRAFNKLNAAQATIELFETVNVICPPACDALYTTTYSSSVSLNNPFHLTGLFLLVPLVIRFLSNRFNFYHL